jgi:ribosome biogenesis protein UTP30
MRSPLRPCLCLQQRWSFLCASFISSSCSCLPAGQLAHLRVHARPGFFNFFFMPSAPQAFSFQIVGTSKLRTKYESYEAKRNLCRQFDLFLADDRVLPSLPKLIGKTFFRRKKQPIPIDLTAADLEAQMCKARECTCLILSGGSCLSIKVARASFSVAAAVANVEAVIAAAAKHVPKKWGNVQAIFLKSADSVALPVYQSLPDRSHKI